MVAIVNVFILCLFCLWFSMHYLIQPSKQAYMVLLCEAQRHLQETEPVLGSWFGQQS